MPRYVECQGETGGRARLEASSDARGDAPVGGAKNQHETIGERDVFAGNSQLIGPLESLGQLRRQIRRVGDDRFDRRMKLSDIDRKSTRLNSSHQIISYAVFCLKKK